VRRFLRWGLPHAACTQQDGLYSNSDALVKKIFGNIV
jgi:hypothetical protein